MALDAPAHGQWRRLLNRGHLIDAAVAAGAADTLVDVNRVVEVHELRHLVDAPPFQRAVFEKALAHRFQQRALVPDLRVAVQAKLGGGNAGVRGAIDGVVTVPTVDPFVAGVVAMIELKRLFDRILHPTRVRCSHIKKQAADRPQCARREHEKGDVRECVVPGPKERSHPRWRSI